MTLEAVLNIIRIKFADDLKKEIHSIFLFFTKNGIIELKQSVIEGKFILRTSYKKHES